MSANLLHRSFAGGELAPELYGRLDLTKYQTGVALARNALVLPHGPLQRRPGLRFVNEARDSTRAVRLIPFAFSADQTVVLEFSHQAVRFFVEGQAVLEPAQDLLLVVGASVQTAAPHGWSTGDDIFVAGRFWRVTVTSSDTATLADRWGAPAAFTGLAPIVASRVYTVATPYDSTDLFGITYAQDNDVLTLCHPLYPARELRRLGAANWALTTVSFAPGLPAPAAPSVVATVPTATNLSPQQYVITAVGADGVTESLASPSAGVANNLTIAGNFNTLTWAAVTGADRYNAYKLRGGTFGFIGQTSALTLVDDNVLADTTRTPPENLLSLNNAPGDYPAAVTYYEQRRWFAGTANNPQTVWGTRSATSSNLTSSVPAQDDDALQFRLASRKQNSIRHLVPLTDLLALTAGGEFRIFSESAPNITPSTLSVKPQGYSGTATPQPALTSGSVLYAQAAGAHVREMAYNWQNNTFSSLDLSLFAPHLFEGRRIVDMAFCRATIPVLWAVRDDGVLLGMTYTPEHQVYAWHRHDTDGLVESVAAVEEGEQDTLYCVVRRQVNGRSVRYVERLASRLFLTLPEAFFVDCGLSYNGPEVTTLTGLWHLEGCTVQVLADGGVHPDRVVESGSIELEAPASIVHVGLQFAMQVQTLPAAFESAPAGGQGATKNVNGVAVRVAKSNLVKAGPSFDRLVEYPDRDVSDNFNTPPALRNEEMRFEIAPDWNSDGSVCFQQDLPLPLTLLSAALDVAPGS